MYSRIDELKYQTKEMESNLLKKKEELKTEIADMKLKDSNIAFKISEIEMLYSERKLDLLAKKVETLADYIKTYEKSNDYEDCNIDSEVEKFVSIEEVPFPETWGLRSTMQAGYMTVFAGGTGSGKSRLVIDLCAYMYLKKKQIAIFSIEVVPASIAIKIAINVLYRKLKKTISYKFAKQLLKSKPSNNEDYKLIKSTIETLGKFVHIIRLDRYTPQNIYSSVNFINLEQKIKFDMVAIDYFQIMNPNDEKDESLTELERNNKISEQLRKVVEKLKIPTIVLAQISGGESETISKEKTSGTRGINYAPKLTHDAENIFKIFREKKEDGSYSDIFELRQVKGRDEAIRNYTLVQEMITGAVIGSD